ncbi:Hypothetical protein PHPALM_1378 [Phytophthora palmivora]|uniref:Thioredoxin domain-containing protein n=1 Tax=Phytophthora palmivora TaxID=4796 RepID=A0A2P4YSH1_9STRA|nr:Hypothetical protein PHPALM_1378 [Phytophthora palmivora]
MWTHTFGAQQAQEKESDQQDRDNNVMKEAMTVLKGMGAIRGENTHEEAAEQAEAAAEDGRERLTIGEGEQEAVGEEETHNEHAAATTGPQLRTEEDTAAYDDRVPLGNTGEIPMVGAMENEVETPSALPTQKEDHKWTAFNELPIAGEASGNENDSQAVVSMETDATQDKGLAPMTAKTTNASAHLWTGVENLPVLEEETTKLNERVQTTATGSSAQQETTLAAQVQSNAFVSRRFDKSRLVLETSQKSNASIPFEKRHHSIFGYNATLAYLQLYMKAADSQEELFLFFTCSDNKGGRDDWNPNCATAREKVYATFAKSPSTNRLVTIHAGPREDWMGGNAFTDDNDLRLKAVPTVMRWDGGAPGALRSTWGVLVDNSILYEPFLRYLFRNADKNDKLLAKPEVETKEIVTLRGYTQYRAYMDTYAGNGTAYPLFIMMVSGRFQRNNRLWCPWCRQSEMPVEYAFYAYAPANAKLVLVETYDKYSEWRNPENEFKQDPQLAMKGFCCSSSATRMPPKAGGYRHAGSGSRRQRWLMMAVAIFAIYCIFLFQMRLWSAASQADLRSNVVNSERGHVVIDRPIIKQDIEHKRETQVNAEVTHQPFHVQVEPTHATPEAFENEQQNLRAVDPPLPTPGAVIVSAPEPATTLPITPVGAPAIPIVPKNAMSSISDRHDVVSGYDEALKYLANYKVSESSDEQLFLFFVCGDKKGEQTAWRRVCVDASELVYDVFAKSPSRNKLLTIYAGSKQDWSSANAFFKDGDLKVKMTPGLMPLHGGRPGAKRATSGMIIEESILYEPLVRYLFKNEDIPDPLLAPEKNASKEIVVLKGYKNYRSYFDGVAARKNPSLTAPEGKMFLFLIAGRLETNDRLWCPYCRYSEISVEYAFYAFAPPGSRLIKVETVPSYGTWKLPVDRNEWKADTDLKVRGVPWMYRANLDEEAQTFSFERVSDRFDRPEALRGIFQGWKNPV